MTHVLEALGGCALLFYILPAVAGVTLLLVGLVLGFRAKGGAALYEAAGETWEPEEPALPERLEMIGRTAVYEGASPYFDANMLLATVIVVPGEPKATARNEAVLREAVRRYNAWPELEVLATNVSAGFPRSWNEIRDQLVSILRG